tara:strand:- start:753 stop:1094 length:342 start_codon:yes stop_codon:yes gene_type:complete
MNKTVDVGYRQKMYEIHQYSFKKFAYTAVSDVLGESAAKAMKGDSDYVQTYYKHTRDEKMRDYARVMPRLSIFTPDPSIRTKQQLDSVISDVSTEDQQGLLKSLLDSKNPSKG